MRPAGTARSEILGAIRRSLAASAPHDAVHRERHAPPTPGERAGSLPVLSRPDPALRPVSQVIAPPADPLLRFRERLEAVGGVCTVVDAREVGRALADVLAEAGARTVGLSGDPAVQRASAPLREADAIRFRDDPRADGLFDCDTGVTGAQWGIAETGTLVLASAHERNRLLSLVPPLHVALLRASSVCGTLREALARVRGEAGAEVPSRAITLITGPSRTSDIELTLAIGVHGPQALHVIVIEDRQTH